MTSLSLSQSNTTIATAKASANSPTQRNDWHVCIDDYTTKKHDQLNPLTFVHLFIIHRLLVKHEVTVEQFTSHMKDKMLQTTSVTLCSELINIGIREYMKTHPYIGHNESDSILIKQMFDTAVNKFSTQYAHVTTYNWHSCKHSSNDSTSINIIDNIDTKDTDTNITNRNTKNTIEHKNNNEKNKNNYNQNNNFNNTQSQKTKMSTLDKNWQAKLFNTSDLMYLIFHFLDYDASWSNNYLDGDLLNCSLVCSYWFYHVFNPKAIYHITISGKSLQLMNKDNSEMNNMIKYKRVWMRFINVRSVYLSFGDKTSKHWKPHSLFLEILSSWRNVAIISGQCYSKQMPMVQVIMNNCREKIEKYELEILSSKMDVLSPLKLINAKYIYIYSWYFDIIWSKICEILKLSQVSVDQEWCNMVINKCDCNGIKSLELNDVFFDLSSVFKKDQRLKILRQLAQKFVNLVHLKMILYKSCEQDVLIFWRMLAEIVEKNKGGTVELTIQLKGNPNYRILNRAMKLDVNLKDSPALGIKNSDKNVNVYIDELVVHCDEYWQWYLDMYDCLKSMITNKNLKHLYIKTWGDEKCKGLSSIIDFIKQSYLKQKIHQSTATGTMATFDSLQCIQIESLYGSWNANDAINVIIDLLNLDIINHGGIFVQLNAIIDGKYNSKLNLSFKQRLDTFYNLVKRLISKQIPISIMLAISGIIDAKFDESIYILLSNINHATYQPPKCNQYCSPLDQIVASCDTQLSLGLHGQTTYTIKIGNVTKS